MIDFLVNGLIGAFFSLLNECNIATAPGSGDVHAWKQADTGFGVPDPGGLVLTLAECGHPTRPTSPLLPAN